MKILNLNDFHGIVLYNIERDGCLNGVFTNVANNGIIYNEVAKKQKKDKETTTTIEGDYLCSYIDVDGIACNITLEIRFNTGTYTFQWFRARHTLIFEGIGFQMNEKQLAVYYKSN